jgi:hypothetical protein
MSYLLGTLQVLSSLDQGPSKASAAPKPIRVPDELGESVAERVNVGVNSLHISVGVHYFWPRGMVWIGQ